MDGSAAAAVERRIRGRLATLYGEDRAATLGGRLRGIVARRRCGGEPRPWSERDALLITYGDAIRRDGEAPLATLGRFAGDFLTDVVSAIHLLPFFPYSSDDGFSVIDYRTVDPALGDWADVAALGERFRLGFDLVLNHASSRSAWFRQFLVDEAPGRDFFVTADPTDDLSDVVRPRSLPLLTEVETPRGRRHVWTTFSADQVDLDFGNPEVLLEFVDVVLEYVQRGAGLLRLDAIAYLWKQAGTPCIHLPRTHEVVKLLRDVLELAAADSWLLTETNVPHAENVAYFGDGDEAQLVYQFSLPPLLLHALRRGDATHLTRWGVALEPPPEGCTFLNFTASHDGIGVRPLEGWIPDTARAALLDELRAGGVHVATKRDADGGDSAYELNVTYVDALARPGEPPEMHVARFLASQTVALSLQGIPALYIHSLFGTRDWREGVARTGRPRTINRRKWDDVELRAELSRPASFHAAVFGELTRRLRLRRQQPAFHPDAGQRVLELGPDLFGVVRTPPDGGPTVVALINVTDGETALPDLAGILRHRGSIVDLLAPARRPDTAALAPYGCGWWTAAG